MSREYRQTGEEVGKGQMRLKRRIAETLTVEYGDGVNCVGGSVRENVLRRKSRVERSHERLGEERRRVGGRVVRIRHCHSDRMLQTHESVQEPQNSKSEITHLSPLCALLCRPKHPPNLSINPLLLRPAPTGTLDIRLGSFSHRNDVDGPRLGPFFELILRASESRWDEEFVWR